MKKTKINIAKFICATLLLFSSEIINAQPMTLQLTSSKYNGYNISCFGKKDGSVDLKVIGGRAPFTYLWSNGKTSEDIADISAGYYKVRVKDGNGVIAEAEVTLDQPDPVKVDLSVAALPNGYNIDPYGGCNGEITAVVQGGVSPYSFVWNDNNTDQVRRNLCSNTYSVSVVDVNGCKIVSSSAYLTQPDRSDWQMDGNSSVVPASQFIGTTDNTDLSFKTNNTERFRINALGNTDFSGSMNLQSGLSFSNSRVINYQPATGLDREILSFGSAPNNALRSINTCAAPNLNTPLNYQFNGTIQLYGNSYMGGNLNIMEIGFDGANSIIDATGTSADPIANRLLLNYYCGHDVFVGNGSSGDLTANHNFFTAGQAAIGTTNLDPAYKLLVNGAIRTKKVVVEIGWADYVFHKDYQLMSITALDKYINKHKHLPNIPTAQEIEEQGLDIGSVQAKQMEKIEEMALYIIQLNKKIEEQSKRIESLERVQMK